MWYEASTVKPIQPPRVVYQCQYMWPIARWLSMQSLTSTFLIMTRWHSFFIESIPYANYSLIIYTLTGVWFAALFAVECTHFLPRWQDSLWRARGKSTEWSRCVCLFQWTLIGTFLKTYHSFIYLFVYYLFIYLFIYHHLVMCVCI